MQRSACANKPRFAAAYAVERLVKVEVIVGDVGQHGDAEAHVGDAAQRERVRTDLHRDRARAARPHLGEDALQIVGERRRVVERPHRVAEVRAERADPARDDPGAVEDRRDKVRRRRLAVGAGDADDRHPERRLAVEGGSQPRERAHLVAHDERGDPGGSGSTDAACSRSSATALAPRAIASGNERRAVLALPAQRDEQRPRPRRARVVHDAVISPPSGPSARTSSSDAANVSRVIRSSASTRRARRPSDRQAATPAPVRGPSGRGWRRRDSRRAASRSRASSANAGAATSLP